jgi:topoisomerase IA-like protein
LRAAAEAVEERVARLAQESADAVRLAYLSARLPEQEQSLREAVRRSEAAAAETEQARLAAISCEETAEAASRQLRRLKEARPGRISRWGRSEEYATWLQREAVLKKACDTSAAELEASQELLRDRRSREGVAIEAQHAAATALREARRDQAELAQRQEAP